MTYHHPMKEGKLLNYGFNFNYLADKYADFFIWRSPVEVYQPSSIANMGRKGNTFYIDPFFNFTNPTNNTSHKIKTRFYYRGDNIIDGSSSHKSLDDILGNMGSDAVTVNAYIDNIKNGDYSPFFPLIQPILQGDLNGIVDGAVNILNGVHADTADVLTGIFLGQRGIAVALPEAGADKAVVGKLVVQYERCLHVQSQYHAKLQLRICIHRT